MLDKTRFTAVAVSLLFLLSSISAPAAVAASANSPLPLAARPLSQLEANWASADGNPFNHNFNPQTQINSSNAQYLGLSWLFPLPTHPTALLSVSGGLGVDTTPLIINGTVYFTTQFGQVFALNAANGNVLWTDVLPILPNSTQGLNAGGLNLHLHQGQELFTTATIGTTINGPTYWISAPDHKIYAINALNGKYELNYSYYLGIKSVDGNNPNSVYAGLATNIQIDQKRGILVASMVGASNSASGRCFYRGWNLNVNPPTTMWTSYCTPPQPGSNIPVDPNWDIKQVNNMTGAQIFYPGAQYNGGGTVPSTAVVDLKKLSTAQLNATLYNDWGYVQTPACIATDAGNSPGATGEGWGAPLLLDQRTGLTVVNTGNRGPYNGACNPGPDLWASAVLALNDTSGKWIWGFQMSAHDEWDWDCSWWQALGNETINGANTEVVWKTCKTGYLVELNAATGSLIWAWTPPQSILARCQYCFMLDPLNSTQMHYEYGNPTLAQTLIYPSETGPFENDASYSPTLNYVFTASMNVQALMYYIPQNLTNYGKNGGQGSLPGFPFYLTKADNATIEAVNAANGQMVWSHFIPGNGYRGGLTNSGGVVYLTLSSGDLIMLDAKTGNQIKDLFIGGPLNVLPSIGATSSGQMEVIVPITAGIVTWGTGVPGDVVALTLQNLAPATTNTVTSTSTVSVAPLTSTATTTVTSTAASTGVSSTVLYGVAAVAVVFIIATGYLAMRSRPKPAG